MMIDRIVNVIAGSRLQELQEELDRSRRNEARLMADLDAELRNRNRTARELREARMSRDGYRQVVEELQRKNREEAAERLIEDLQLELALRKSPGCARRKRIDARSLLLEEIPVQQRQPTAPNRRGA
jgi:hypothetical protein